jgi:hypothetical protein
MSDIRRTAILFMYTIAKVLLVGISIAILLTETNYFHVMYPFVLDFSN